MQEANTKSHRTSLTIKRRLKITTDEHKIFLYNQKQSKKEERKWHRTRLEIFLK